MERFYTCCPEPYPTLKFILHIRRRTLYYGINVIIPSLIISLMTILGFILPPDACEKITLEITVLLAICFFLDVVKRMTPPTSEAVPLIVVFFSCCMLIVTLSCIFTVVVINLNFRTPDTHEITPLADKIFLNWLPWMLMMERPYTKSEPPSWVPRKKTSSGIEKIEAETDAFKDKQLHTRINELLQPLMEQLKNEPNPNPYYGLTLLLETIHKDVEFITMRLRRFDLREEVRTNWKFAAMVVDRLCLVIFSIIIGIGTCGIMFSAPHLTA